MNCYTRGEKIDMALEAFFSALRTAVEIAVIVAGVVAMGVIAYMNHQITVLENQLAEMEEQNQEEVEERLIIRDPVTGRIIYDQPR